MKSCSPSTTIRVDKHDDDDASQQGDARKLGQESDDQHPRHEGERECTAI